MFSWVIIVIIHNRCRKSNLTCFFYVCIGLTIINTYRVESSESKGYGGRYRGKIRNQQNNPQPFGESPPKWLSFNLYLTKNTRVCDWGTWGLSWETYRVRWNHPSSPSSHSSRMYWWRWGMIEKKGIEDNWTCLINNLYWICKLAKRLSNDSRIALERFGRAMHHQRWMGRWTSSDELDIFKMRERASLIRMRYGSAVNWDSNWAIRGRLIERGGDYFGNFQSFEDFFPHAPLIPSIRLSKC